MVGTTFGRYLIQKELGRGGMGVVYRAYDIKLDRQVAIKVLSQDLQSQITAWGFLLKEAQIASALNHPCICTIYDVGEEDNQPYIAMEYIEGCGLDLLLKPSGIPSDLLGHSMRETVGALAHAHERGIIHRDIKSSNIIITYNGSLKILDFGLAKRLRATLMQGISAVSSSSQDLGRLPGTIQYLAPEVLRGERANVCSDLWSLGVLLYELATGALPFHGKTAFELATAIMTSNPAPPPQRVPIWAAHVIARCLERNPALRYHCARDIGPDLPLQVNYYPASDLAKLIDHLPTSQAQPTSLAAGAV
jgi:serine/threonine protein kinase